MVLLLRRSVLLCCCLFGRAFGLSARLGTVETRLGAVEKVVVSVQHALDVATADISSATAAAESLRERDESSYYVRPIEIEDVALRVAELRDSLQRRHHAVVRMEMGDLLEGARSLLEDPAQLDDLGVARPVHDSRPTEFIGVFQSERSTFVELRYDADRRIHPSPGPLEETLDTARRRLGGLGSMVVQICDSGSSRMVDDVSCFGISEGLSSTAHRLCLYEPSSDKQAFGPHTDTTFFTIVPFAAIPGLEVFDPSLGAWICPEAAGNSKDCVLMLPGELLELATDGAYKSAVHRVIATSRRRVSAPLLLRGALHATIRGVSMASAWAALQAATPEDASLRLQKSDEDVAIILPKRTSEEAADFAFLRGGKSARVLSVEPLLIAIDDFASSEDCFSVLEKALAEESAAFLHSEVLSPTQGIEEQQIVEPNYRTSRTKWMDDSEVPTHLSDRASLLAGEPLTHAERWQLARYSENQQYTLHTDTVDDFNNLVPSGRVSTLLLYLDDDFEGGHTAFPALDVDFKPKKGTAIFFHNVKVPVIDAYGLETEHRAAHCGKPLTGPTGGHKHILTKWFHPLPYPDGPV